MKFFKKNSPEPEEEPEVEPINMGFTDTLSGVVLYIQSRVTDEIIFNITISPEMARDAAFKLSWYAMKVEDAQKKLPPTVQ